MGRDALYQISQLQFALFSMLISLQHFIQWPLYLFRFISVCVAHFLAPATVCLLYHCLPLFHMLAAHAHSLSLPQFGCFFRMKCVCALFFLPSSSSSSSLLLLFVCIFANFAANFIYCCKTAFFFFVVVIVVVVVAVVAAAVTSHISFIYVNCYCVST